MNVCKCGKKIRKNKTGLCRQCWNNYRSRERCCLTCHLPMSSRGSSKKECRSCYDRRKRLENLEEHNRKHREYLRKRKGKPIEGESKSKGNLGHIEKSTGYKTLRRPNHPNVKNKQGRVYEHVLVMTEYLQRPMRPGETIHHKNGIRDDNRIENLELWDTNHPPGQRVQDKIQFYIEFLKLHGYKITKNSHEKFT